MRPPDFLIRLMYRGNLPWATRVKPEENLCISISNLLREQSLKGTLKAIWSHVPNEGKRHIKVAAIMKAMGLLSGTPDYFFIWVGGGGVIEIKTKVGRLSDGQKDYKSWCDHFGIKHAVCRSLGEVYDTLILWGALKPEGSPP